MASWHILWVLYNFSTSFYYFISVAFNKLLQAVSESFQDNTKNEMTVEIIDAIRWISRQNISEKYRILHSVSLCNNHFPVTIRGSGYFILSQIWWRWFVTLKFMLLCLFENARIFFWTKYRSGQFRKTVPKPI